MRRGLKIVGGILAGILLLVVGALFVFTNSDWGRERVRRFALKSLNKTAHGVVRMGRLSGNLLTGAIVDDFSITDSSGAPFVAIRQLRARYAVRALIGKKLIFTDVQLTRPVIVLDRQPGGPWNYDRIFPRDTTKKDTSTAPGYGDWIELYRVRMSQGQMVVRSPWTPDAGLKGRQLDSAVAYAFSGESRLNVIRIPNGYQKVSEFRGLTGDLPYLRLARPDTKVRRAEVASLRGVAEMFKPPAAEIRDLKGAFDFTTDSLWFRDIALRMPGTSLAGSGRYMIESGDFLLTAHAAPLALADLRWVYPRLPSQGGGTLDYFMDWRTTGDKKSQEYVAKNVDARIGATTLAGSFGLLMTDTLAFHDTDLRFTALDTRLIEQLAPSAKLPRRGVLGGRLAVAGGFHALDLNTDVTFDDTRSGRSRLVARGQVGADSSVFRAKDLRLQMLPVQVDLARIAVPTLPIGGTVSGLITLNGTTRNVVATAADVTHVEGAARSHLLGRAAFRFAGKPGALEYMDVNLRAQPIALTTVGKFMPAAGLQGVASGPLTVRGSMHDLVFASDMRISGGGSLAAQGRVDLAGKNLGYDIAASAKTFNANAIMAKAPRTELTAELSAAGRGTDPATMQSNVSAFVSTSVYDSTTVDSLRARLNVASGVLTIDTLTIAAPGASARVKGNFGLAAGHAGTIIYDVAVDSLSKFSRWLPHDTGAVAPRPAVVAQAIARARADSARAAKATEVARAVTGGPPIKLVVDTPKVVRRDSLSGSLYAAGVVSGSLPAFDVRGRAGAEKLVALGNTAQGIRAEYAWTGARTPQSKIVAGVTIDSVSAGGFQIDTIDTRFTYDANKAGLAQIVVRQDKREYSVKGDYVLHTDHNEVHFADLRMRFDTTVWASTRPGAVHWGPSGIEVRTVELRNGSTGRIYVNGLIPTAGDANLELAIENFQVGNIVTLLQSDVDASGLVSVAARLQGTRADPRLHGALGLANAMYNNTKLPDLRATLDYAAQRFAARAEASRNGGAPLLVAEAKLPMNLAMAGTVTDRFPDRDLAVDVTIDSLPLEVIPQFTTAVRDVYGRAVGKIAVRGTRSTPRIAGALAFDRGSATIDAAGIRLADMAGALRVRNDSIVIDSLVAFSTGRIRIDGGVGIRTLSKPSLDLHLVASNAKVIGGQRGRAWADADITARGPFDRVAARGRVVIDRGVIYLPESNGKNVEVLGSGDPTVFNVVDTSVVANRELVPAQSALLANLQMAVNLTVNRDVWVRSQAANVEIYSDGPINIRVNRATNSLTLDGALATDRGEYTFLSKRFQITRGAVTFTGGQEINPLVQATAEYGVQIVGREALNIRLVIGGTAQNPRLTLESDAQPPISQSDLLSYLAFGRSSSSLLASEGGSSGGGSSGSSGLVGQTAALARNQLTGVALGVFVGQLQSEAARSLGADVLNITPADLPPELSAGGVSTFLRGTEVEYGKYWNTRTFVGLQARPEALGDLPGLISGRPGKAPPGARYQYRTQKGYQFEASVQPRYELTAPSLATTTPSKFGVLGLFVTREWRF